MDAKRSAPETMTDEEIMALAKSIPMTDVDADKVKKELVDSLKARACALIDEAADAIDPKTCMRFDIRSTYRTDPVLFNYVDAVMTELSNIDQEGLFDLEFMTYGDGNHLVVPYIPKSALSDRAKRAKASKE